MGEENVKETHSKENSEPQKRIVRDVTEFGSDGTPQGLQQGYFKVI